MKGNKRPVLSFLNTGQDLAASGCRLEASQCLTLVSIFEMVPPVQRMQNHSRYIYRNLHSLVNPI